MRLSYLALTLALLGAGANLEAARKSPRKAAPAKAAPAKKTTGKVAEFHVVRKHENGARIAKQYRLSLEELEILNPELDLGKLAVGTRLRIAKGRETHPAVAARPHAARPLPGVLPILPALPESGPTNLARLERMLPTEVGARKAENPILGPRALSSQLQPVLAGDPNGAPAQAFTPADPANLDFLWPVETRTVSSDFGPRMRTRTTLVKSAKSKKARRIKKRYQGVHRGIDLNAPKGSDVYAALDGKVVEVRRDRGYGNFVIIDHGNGVQTLYGHNTANLVQVGDVVRRGQKIALVGSTGHSTGPHVHFEVILNGIKVNPEPFLNMVDTIPEDLVAQNESLTLKASPSRR